MPTNEILLITAVLCQSYYSNLDINLITDNKKLWKTVKPLFSDKRFSNNKITLVNDDEIISTDNEVAKTLNSFFTNALSYLNIKGSKLSIVLIPSWIIFPILLKN